MVCRTKRQMSLDYLANIIFRRKLIADYQEGKWLCGDIVLWLNCSIAILIDGNRKNAG